MSRLPEKGEVMAAAEALERRLEATHEGREWSQAAVNGDTGEMIGDEFQIRGVYGDLFDIGELAKMATGPVTHFIGDIALGKEPEVAMRSMYMMAVAHGVLLERARWEATR